MKKQRRARKNGAIKVGDLVRFRFGTRDVTVEVIEDRGEIGVDGRQLVAVLVPSGGDERLRLEMPADEVTVVRKTTRVSPSRWRAERSAVE
jgi:hypothetical protein